MLVKKLIRDSLNTVFQIKQNMLNGIYVGAWVGLFTGFLWVIASAQLKIQYIELGSSILSPFILILFTKDEVFAVNDFREAIFITVGSTVAGFTAILGTLLLDKTEQTSPVEMLSGAGIGLFIGCANAFMLIERGI